MNEEVKGEESKIEEGSSNFVKANAMRFRRREAEKAKNNMMEGVEGFKFVGTDKKLEIKQPARNEEMFLAWDIYDWDGL